MESKAQYDKRAYELAKEYLLKVPGVTSEMVEKHISPEPEEMKPDKRSDVYGEILRAAQNRAGSPNVIGGAIDGRVDGLRSTLWGFEPGDIVKAFGDNSEKVLDVIVEEVRPRGQVRRGARGLWPQFCKTILSGAAFLSQFETASGFYEWVDFFDKDDRARAALPMLLATEIHGFGFPLACDFLKELGYLNFAKPDTHLKKIFAGLGLSSTGADYPVFKAITRVARNVGVPPYNVDKLFWLIGSGTFYLDAVEVGSHRDAFISLAKERLGIGR